MPATLPIPGLLPVLANMAAQGVGDGGTEMVQVMQRLVLQLAVILIAARIGCGIFERYLRLPGVLGEMAAGMVIGPYALGHFAIPHFGPLFPAIPGHVVPVTPELYGIATIASLLLLFLSGLETDLGMFLRYSTVGTAVGLGGVIFSFALGAACAVTFGLASSWVSPAALFLGTVATATSVGITARILTERKKTDSPEGVTILAGAVLDDVLGIIVLAVVVAIARSDSVPGAVPWGSIGRLAAKTFGWWVAFTAIGILSARRLGRWLKLLGSNEVIASLALGLAFLLAGLLESVGLAMIIGAYIMGLSLSRTDLVHVVQNQLRGAYNMFVPVFFCVMGMLIDFSAMRGAVVAGLVYSVVAILAKIGGCALPAYLMRFNGRGALRIGVGMVPRGEVALIVAGLGLSSGAIGPSTFGVAVMMPVITMLVAPPILVRAFEGGRGLRAGVKTREAARVITLDFKSVDIAEFVIGHLARAFQQEEFFVHALQLTPPVYQVRKEEMVFTLQQEEGRVTLSGAEEYLDIARFVLLEEVLELRGLADSINRMQSPEAIGGTLAGDLFC